MKDQNEKLREITKLKELAPYPIDSSFVTGYLAFFIPSELVKEVKDIVQQLMGMVEDHLVSAYNLLELLIILRFEVFGPKSPNNKKTLTQIVEPYLNELALDNSYFARRYFQQDIPIEDIVPQSLGIQCTICTTDIISSQLCCLSCGHMFHRECLNNYSKQKINNKIIPFPCPQQQCKIDIMEEEANEFLSKDLREKYAEFAFQNYVEAHMDDTSWCPTPGCSAVFAFDAALTDYRCPACKKHYCLACKCEFHTNITCQEYRSLSGLNEEDKQFMMLVKGSKFKQCPSCKFWVEKNQGCDHMTCRCKYQFCYVCGGKYNRCKCQGFVNEVEQPRLLNPLPAVGVPVPPVLPPPPPPPPQRPHLANLFQRRRSISPIARPPPSPARDKRFAQLYIDEHDNSSNEVNQELVAELGALNKARRAQEEKKQKNQQMQKEMMLKLSREEEAKEQIRIMAEMRQAERRQRLQMLKMAEKQTQKLIEEQKIRRIEQQRQRKMEEERRLLEQIQKEEEAKKRQAEKRQAFDKKYQEERKKREEFLNSRNPRLRDTEDISLKLKEQRERLTIQLKANEEQRRLEQGAESLKIVSRPQSVKEEDKPRDEFKSPFINTEYSLKIKNFQKQDNRDNLQKPKAVDASTNYLQSNLAQEPKKSFPIFISSQANSKNQQIKPNSNNGNRSNGIFLFSNPKEPQRTRQIIKQEEKPQINQEKQQQRNRPQIIDLFAPVSINNGSSNDNR